MRLVRLLLCVLVLTCAALPCAADTWVWISDNGDGTFHNMEGYFRTTGGVAADHIQYGGDLMTFWQTNVREGDTFVIGAHGIKLTIHWIGGGWGEFEGGTIKLNSDLHAGFRLGTNPPPCGILPYPMPALGLPNITVALWSCYGARVPALVDGAGAWPDGKSVKQSVEDLLSAGGGSGEVDPAFEGCARCGIRHAWVRQDAGEDFEAFWLWLDFKIMTDWGFEDLRDWLDSVPYDDHGFVLVAVAVMADEYNTLHGTHFTLTGLEYLLLPPAAPKVVTRMDENSGERVEEIDLTSEAHVCEGGASSTEETTWGTIKSIYR